MSIVGITVYHNTNSIGIFETVSNYIFGNIFNWLPYTSISNTQENHDIHDIISYIEDYIKRECIVLPKSFYNIIDRFQINYYRITKGIKPICYDGTYVVMSDSTHKYYPDYLPISYNDIIITAKVNSNIVRSQPILKTINNDSNRNHFYDSFPVSITISVKKPNN